MKMDCEVIRDLLPLYADEICSDGSRRIVDEHLQECDECRELLDRLRETEVETHLTQEKDLVIRDAARRFRRRSAAVGSAVSGTVLVPVLVLLALNFLHGPTLSWISVVLASLCVAASLSLVPIFVPEDKFFWTFCAFCASVLLLLGVICLFTRGNWFWIASSAVLFGLSAVFLPFLIRERPIRERLGNSNRTLLVLGVDALLLLNLLSSIAAHGRVTLNSLLFSLVAVVGIAVVLVEVVRHGKFGKADREEK